MTWRVDSCSFFTSIPKQPTHTQQPVTLSTYCPDTFKFSVSSELSSSKPCLIASNDLLSLSRASLCVYRRVLLPRVLPCATSRVRLCLSVVARRLLGMQSWLISSTLLGKLGCRVCFEELVNWTKCLIDVDAQLGNRERIQDQVIDRGATIFAVFSSKTKDRLRLLY